MTFPTSLARWMDRLTGEAHSYACDYAAWWLEGGRQPVAGAYVSEDDTRFTVMRAAKIAAHIRSAVR